MRQLKPEVAISLREAAKTLLLVVGVFATTMASVGGFVDPNSVPTNHISPHQGALPELSYQEEEGYGELGDSIAEGVRGLEEFVIDLEEEKEAEEQEEEARKEYVRERLIRSWASGDAAAIAERHMRIVKLNQKILEEAKRESALENFGGVSRKLNPAITSAIASL